MAAAVSCAYDFKMTVRETLGTGVPAASSPIITFDSYNESGTLNAGSGVPATKHVQFLLTLVAGAATIDLTALTGANGTVDGTGLKVRIMRIKPLGANDITIAEGAANGYAMCGASFTKIIRTGGVWQELFAAGAPTIAAGDKVIDVTGTAVQTAEVSILLG